jgi:hypothetical protein
LDLEVLLEGARGNGWEDLLAISVIYGTAYVVQLWEGLRDVRRLNFSKVELCVYFRWVLFRLSAFFFTPLLTFLLLYGVSVFTSWISYNFGFSHWLLRFVKTEFCCSNFTQFQGPKWDLGGVKKKCGGPKENFSLFYGSNEKSI